MILQNFDESRDAVINPQFFNEKIAGFPKTAVSFFSQNLMQEFLKMYNPEVVAKIRGEAFDYNIYKVNYKGCDLAVYQSPVGAPACVMNFEDVVAVGAKNLLLVGCCGCLDKQMEDCSIIIPTSAIRDEGTSYHYMKESDEVQVDAKSVEILESVMNEKHINYSKCKTWTTDAFYRETRTRLSEMVKKGAKTVDMECSAMIAVSKFRGVNFAQIFYAADNLGAEEYDPRSLMKEDKLDSKFRVIPLALDCGVELDKKL